MSTAPKPTIYTIGYSGSTPQDIHKFVEELDAILVDIRYSPKSRQPQWNSGALYSTFPRGRYTWARSLGNRNYNNDGPIQLDDPDLGLALVRALTRSLSVILMCGCRDVRRCHRKVAAEYLAGELGFDVVHLPATFDEWSSSLPTGEDSAC